MNIKDFEKLPLMGILRGVSAEDIESLFETVIEAGLKTVEITMNTPGAPELIKSAIDVSGGRILVGAGTVLNAEDAKKALAAGAEFIVMPANNKEVIEECKKREVPAFPGAFSPQEVIEAWDSGVSMVKVFPCGLFGPRYIKELKGPFDKVKLMAVGGVSANNITEYFDAGASAIAFGGSVFKKELLEKKKFKEIGRVVSSYVEKVKEFIE